MNWMNIIVKSFITCVIAVTLTGCTKKSFFSGFTKGKAKESQVVDDLGRSSTQAINDPAVRAIVKSGKLTGVSPEKIRQLLQKQTYYFNFDSDSIHKSDYESLDVLVALLSTSCYQDTKLLLEGNTDQRGTRNYNVGLGFRRANAVKDYLLEHGIDKKRLDVASFGFEKPADPANNPVAWRKNRRVEIVLKNTPAV